MKKAVIYQTVRELQQLIIPLQRITKFQQIQLYPDKEQQKYNGDVNFHQIIIDSNNIIIYNNKLPLHIQI